MSRQQNITSAADIAGAKPIVQGTRLAVEFVLGLFAAGSVREGAPTATMPSENDGFCGVAVRQNPFSRRAHPAVSYHVEPGGFVSERCSTSSAQRVRNGIRLSVSGAAA